MKRACPVGLLLLLTLARPAATQSAVGTVGPDTVAAATALAAATTGGAATVAAEASATPQATSSCPTPLRLRQLTLTDVHSDFARVAQLAGAAPLRPLLIRRSSEAREALVCADRFTGDWARNAWGHDPAGVTLPTRLDLELLPLAWSSHYNTAYPQDRNQGVLWAGRGLATELRGGVALRWGPLSAALAPVLHYQENRDFEFASAPVPEGYSPYIYRGRMGTIDWPQRMGDRSFSGVDLGDSYLRLDISHLALGISHESLWWGPARRTPLMMSNTGPGFAHIFLGSSRPVDIWLGRFETQLIWGRLEESAYFDDNPDNERRLLASIVLGFEPRWAPGLYLGASRSYLRAIPPEGLDFDAWFLSPYRDVRDNPLGRGNDAADNQLFSVFARWAPPRAGFEAYLEFARDDHWADSKDLLAEPDVSSAFTLGFQQVVPRGERWLRIAGEVTRIADPYPTVRRPLFTFYAHGQLRQGYTHRGRLLGASIGPNANAQFLGIDLFTPTGRRGIFLERVRYNVDAASERWVRNYGAEGADVEWNVGIHHDLFLRHLDLGWAITHSYRRNRHYIGLHADPVEFHSERNWTLRFDLGWRPWGRAPLAAVLGER